MNYQQIMSCVAGSYIPNGIRNLKEIIRIIREEKPISYEEFLLILDKKDELGWYNNTIIKIFKDNVLYWIPTSWLFHQHTNGWAKYKKGIMEIEIYPESPDDRIVDCCYLARMAIERLKTLNKIKYLGIFMSINYKGIYGTVTMHKFKIPFNDEKFGGDNNYNQVLKK